MAINLGDIYLKCTAKEQGFKQPARWNKMVEAAANPSFNSVAGSIQLHDNTSLIIEQQMLLRNLLMPKSRLFETNSEAKKTNCFSSTDSLDFMR
jgi:hypothetical protein